MQKAQIRLTATRFSVTSRHRKREERKGIIKTPRIPNAKIQSSMLQKVGSVALNSLMSQLVYDLTLSLMSI